MPKRLGAETSRAETARCWHVWGQYILVPKSLVAETSTGQNVLVPSCYPTLLIIIALAYRKSMAERLSRMLSYVTQGCLLRIHRTSPLRSRRHSHKEILEFFFSSTLLKSSAETEKNSSKLVLPTFFTILYISLALLLVSVTQRDFRREWFQWRPWSHDLNGCLWPWRFCSKHSALPKINFDQILYRKANTCVFAIK